MTTSFGLMLFLSVILVAASCREGTGPGTPEDFILWSVPSGSPTDGTPHDPAANADRSMVYFVAPDYRLKKIDGMNGQVVWESQAGSVSATFPQWNAVLSGHVVAIAKVDVLAFDTTTGLPRWTYVAPDGEATGYSPLVANDSTVFAAGRTARIHAIDASAGSARWVADLRESQPDIGALNPTYYDNILYVCTLNFLTLPSRGTLWALDAQTGSVKWTFRFQPELPTQGSACYGSAAIWQDLVIQPQEDGRVLAFDRRTGVLRWTAPRVHDVSQSLGDRRWAAVGGNHLLVTSQANRGMIVAYDPATGAERWRDTQHGGSLYPPVLDESTAYVDHGWIFASYDLMSGKVRWQTPQSVREPATVFKGRPIIVSDRIYVAGRNGSYGLRR
ncbi:MAG: PQQ-binding-like beta-propeller repeat protein [Gemmatimonadaceae bacterium]